MMWAGSHPDQDCLAVHTSYYLFKPRSQVRLRSLDPFAVPLPSVAAMTKPPHFTMTFFSFKKAVFGYVEYVLRHWVP